MAQPGFYLPPSVSPIDAAVASTTHIKRVLPIPDIIEFVLSDKYLNRPNLYPRQATILKTIFLQDEIFTSYDLSVLAEWSEGFTLNPHPNSEGIMRYQGNHGVQPDILARITQNKKDERNWFREAVMVLGRRGSKGFIGAICGAYVLWNFMSLGNPQLWYGVDRDKPLSGLVFAGKLNQAKTEQFGDLTNIILGSTCFAPYISRSQSEMLSLYTTTDLVLKTQAEARGVFTDNDYASMRLVPKESTLMAGRGMAAFLQYYDEMAHVSASTARASAELVYEAATPALDQFGTGGFIYEGSSPWQMSGQFYQNWLNALEVDAKTGKAVYPQMVMFQLESWDTYKDWEKASQIRTNGGIWKTGPQAGQPKTQVFAPLTRAMSEYNDDMRRLERANPETFAVERRAHWASSQNAYLNPQRISEMFGPYEGSELVMQTSGHLQYTYVAHIDPSKSGANTALAIAHLSPEPDDQGFHHVIFDVIKHWIPGDFDGSRPPLPDNDRQIDYIYLENEWNKNVTDAFMPSDFTFDQFDASIIQRIRKYARDTRRPKSTRVYERTATKALNWKMAEAFKTALGLGIIHAPYYEQAEQELIYLQDIGHERVEHPTDGPIQTSDVADALFNVTHALIGEQMAAFLNNDFVDFSVSGMLAGGIQPFSAEMAGPNSDANEIFSQFSQMNVRRGEALAHASPARVLPRGGSSSWNTSNPFGRRSR